MVEEGRESGVAGVAGVAAGTEPVVDAEPLRGFSHAAQRAEKRCMVADRVRVDLGFAGHELDQKVGEKGSS